jgi:hypothetical protein
MINIENFIACLKMEWVKKLIFDTAMWLSIIGTEVDISNVINLDLFMLYKNLRNLKRCNEIMEKVDF